MSKDRIANESSDLALSGQVPTDLLALNEKLKSMMTKSQNLIQANWGQETAMICKVCQKEGRSSQIRNHIEANHLEGIVIPCNFCDKVLSSRNNFLTRSS